MQLASQGGRAAARNLNASVQETPQQRYTSTRGLNTTSLAQATPRVSAPPGPAQKLFSKSRTLLGRFFAHLTTPGSLGRLPSAPHVPSLARSFQGAAVRGQGSIQSGLSFPVRTALARPLPAPFFPRPPAIPPRCMTQVGLGTARNFSSARPIFQNLIENVPVAGRAFWEADWEIKMHEERTRMVQKPPKRERRKDGGTEMMMPAFEAVLLEKERKVLADGGELEHYFPAPPVPNVTTCLSIPLVPTPTSRFPLPEFTSSNPSLLPLATLGSLHASHATHALRVSSLFARLDTAHVWTKNVSCSAYAHGPAVGPGDGVCTVLKVEFVGWTAAEVRGVIGESGTGWCVLEELRTGVEEDDDEDASSVLSGMSSEMGGEWRDAGLVESVDLADSFVIPTLDFSVGAAFSPPPTDWASDSGSDISSPSSIDSALSGGSWVQQYPDALLQGSGRFGFSSDFAGRVGSGSGIWGYEYEYELRESIF